MGRWRATLAHEAAHVVLHRFLYEFAASNLSLFGGAADAPATPNKLLRCLKRDASYRVVSDWREVQANKGMAALLMPRQLFIDVARAEIATHYPSTGTISAGDGGEVVATLAGKFAVSKQAARIRLDSLGVLTPSGQGQL